VLVYRVCKTRHPVLDGTGAERSGSRWHSPGTPVVHASTCCAGSLLEILVQRGRLRLPGAYHAGEILIPDDVLVERLEPRGVPGWDEPESLAAREHGDAWLHHQRTVALLVPSVPGRPLQSGVLLNPRHPDFARVRLLRTIEVPWDPRLFGVATM
jgi:RES domain-containing protein